MDIDTPELNGKCESERRLAIRARDRLRVLLNSGEIALAVVTVSGRSVGDRLVSEGLGRTWSGRREPWC